MSATRTEEKATPAARLESPKEKKSLKDLTNEIKAEELVFSLIEINDDFHLAQLLKGVTPKPRLDIRNKARDTPLIHAVRMNSSLTIMKLLIEEKADVNLHGEYGWNALMRAAQKENFGNVKLLVESKADVKSKFNGFNAIDNAYLPETRAFLKAALPPVAVTPAKPASKSQGILGSIFKPKKTQNQARGEYQEVSTTDERSVSLSKSSATAD